MPRARASRGPDRIAFASPPPIGLALVLGEQRFDLVGYDDHTRLDGQPTRLTVWHSHCPVCDEPFTTRSPVMGLPTGRRCPDHHRPGLRVRPAA